MTTLQTIIEDVREEFDITLTRLVGRKRHDRKAELARYFVIYRARRYLDCTLKEIGMALGDRTPGTICLGYKKIVAKLPKARPVLNLKQKIIKHHGRYRINACPKCCGTMYAEALDHGRVGIWWVCFCCGFRVEEFL